MAQEIKVGIQGGKASFHEMAARQYFAEERISILSCMSFRQLCDALETGSCDYALMAIENIVAGSILTNYNLLQQHDFNIIGELWLLIEQNLMALPDQKLEDINTVQSHPVALLQCGDFLKQHPYFHTQEADDTAESAREIREKELPGIAAIASRQAAELYGLTIIEENIADLKENYTRFLVLSRHPEAKPTQANKASLILGVSLLDGSISAVTDQLHKLKTHVSLIQSLPAPISSSTHFVAIDIVCGNYEALQESIELLRPHVKQIQVLGLYKKDTHPKEQYKVPSSEN